MTYSKLVIKNANSTNFYNKLESNLFNQKSKLSLIIITYYLRINFVIFSYNSHISLVPNSYQKIPINDLLFSRPPPRNKFLKDM